MIGNGGEEAVARGNRLRPGVEQGKAPGAVSRLHHARRKAALSHGGGLLVAGDAEDTDRSAEQIGRSEIAGAIPQLRQQLLRNTEQFAQLRVPLPAIDVHQQRASGIGRIGCMHLAGSEPPEQKTVHGAEGEPARRCRRSCALDMIEQPGNLGGGEIRIEEEPGARSDRRLVSGLPQRRDGVGSPPILPDDGIGDRLAGRAVPDDAGLPLIGDAEGSNILRFRPGLIHGGAHGFDRSGPDGFGIVLDPPGRRIDLRKFLLRACNRRQPEIEDNGAGGGSALINGDDEVGQACSLVRGSRSCTLSKALATPFA